MKQHIRIAYCVLSIALIATVAWASPEMVAFKSAAVWRADGEGDYDFKGGKLSRTSIAEDGSVVAGEAPGTYELATPYITDGLIWGITANYNFSGRVTLEVSATGKNSDYVPVVNGVPLEWGGFTPGAKLMWRAKLEPGSSLTEVRIKYVDISGVLGTFGTPELTGFKFRKPIYIKGSPEGGLFNYELALKVGESSNVADCDFYLKGVLQADFRDVRFTAADKETLLPHWREYVSGSSPNRTALFWVRIPQLPADGLTIYVYYGKKLAADLSNGEVTFNFFDDFSAEMLDVEKWSAFDFTKGIIEYKMVSRLSLDTLDAAEMTNEEVRARFANVGEYEWIRARQAVATPPTLDAEETAGGREDVPNLPKFDGTTVAANGDLVLAEDETTGEYISPTIYAPFKTRIMVPGWEKTGIAAIDISANGGITYKTDCKHEGYYYASRGDFAAGESVIYRARLSRASDLDASPSLKKAYLDFRPGAITVVTPDGGEALMPGDDYEITWTAWEYEPSYEMALAYSADGGATYAGLEKTENDGKYLWAVPKEFSDIALIKIYDALEESVFDTSNDYFSIGIAVEEPIEEEEPEEDIEEIILEEIEEELEEDVTKKRPGTGLYELLIKVGMTGSGPGAYRDGDIVMIKPAGFLWGANTKREFLIVEAYLTKEETKKLVVPKQGARRKYRLNMSKPALLGARIVAIRELLQLRPVVGIEDIQEK